MKIRINTKNGATITGDFYDNKKSNNGVVMLPGFTGHRSILHNLAKKISKHSKVWLFDLNSQGESTGKFDFHQINESFSSITKKLKKEYKLKKIGAFGQSLGAVVMMNIEAEDKLFDCLCFISMPENIEKTLDKFYYLKKIPKSILRTGIIFMDKIFTIVNYNYREKTPSITPILFCISLNISLRSTSCSCLVSNNSGVLQPLHLYMRKVLKVLWQQSVTKRKSTAET